jgi:hypothetical protein
MGTPVFDQPHENFLEAIHFVAHRNDIDAMSGQLTEQKIHALILGQFGFDRSVVDARQHNAIECRQSGARSPEV